MREKRYMNLAREKGGTKMEYKKETYKREGYNKALDLEETKRTFPPSMIQSIFIESRISSGVTQRH